MRRPNVTTEGAPCGYVIGRDLYQIDYDFPAGATRCGWCILRVQRDKSGKVRVLTRTPRDYGKRAALGYCEHGGTDGTVNCPGCGIEAGDFIEAAAEFLDSIAF